MLIRNVAREYIDRYIAAHLVSWLVLNGARIVMWVAVVEVIGLMASVPIKPLALNLSLYSLSSVLMWIAAAIVAYLSFSLSLALVVEKEKWGLEEPRHIAYAWSCGLTGMMILSFEVFGGFEFRFEDLLLGMAGLNALVEEVRLRIVLGKSDSSRRRRETAQDPTENDHLENSPEANGASVSRLALRLGVTILVICLASWATRRCFPPVPGLVVRSGDGEASLEWKLSVDDFSGRFEYQHRLLNGVYPDAWSPTQGSWKHVVEGLENGLVYVFRVRALRENQLAGAASNEASVVPSETNGRPERTETETPLAALKRKVAALEARYSCSDSVLAEVWFDHGSALVLPTASPDLATRNETALSAALTNLRDAEAQLVVVTGYASAPGRASYNLNLSEARALAVIEYLTKRAEPWNGEFVALANGERWDGSGGGEDNENRRAVVALCPTGD